MEKNKTLKKFVTKTDKVLAVILSGFVFGCSSQMPSPYLNTIPQDSHVSDVPTSPDIFAKSKDINTSYEEVDTDNVDVEEVSSDSPSKVNDSSLLPSSENLPRISSQEVPKTTDITSLPKIPFSKLAKKVYERVSDSQYTKESSSTMKTEFLASDKNKLIKMFIDGEEIFTGFKELISKAEHEVDLVTFIWDSSSDPAKAIGEGIKLASQNVKDKNKLLVRIIANDFQLDPKRMIDELNDWKKKLDLDSSKVDVQLAVYPHFALGASHSKYLVIDGKQAIVTGANVEKAHNFTSKKWHDTGYLWEGSIASTILKDFDESWEKRAFHWECKGESIILDCIRAKTPEKSDRSYVNNYAFEPGISILALPFYKSVGCQLNGLQIAVPMMAVQFH